MQLDNEENAELSIKAIIEMQKFYKTSNDVLVRYNLVLIEFNYCRQENTIFSKSSSRNLSPTSPKRLNKSNRTLMNLKDHRILGLNIPSEDH